MIRYQYVPDFSPPAPFVHAVFRSPTAEPHSSTIPAQIDSAADRTVIPERLVADLQLVAVRQIIVQGLGGDLHTLDTYIVMVQIHDLKPMPLEVVAHSGETFALLGRDMLNQFRIVLDGPREVLEMD